MLAALFIITRGLAITSSIRGVVSLRCLGPHRFLAGLLSVVAALWVSATAREAFA